MRHLNYSHLLEINEKYSFLNDIKYFVETGTYQGGTIENLHNYFFELHSIELNKQNYDLCIQKFLNTKKIKLYNNNSINILSTIIKNINSRTLYFLDAHYSCNDKTISSRGNEDVPILKELEIIINNDINDSIIIINNYRLFGKNKCKETANTDWSKIILTNINNILKLENIEKQFLLPSSLTIKKNDKYIIFLKKRKLEIVENEIVENEIEENEIEENEIEEEKLDLIFYKNGYMYNNEFKSSLISQNRDYLGQLLRMRDQLNLNIIDKREIEYNQ